MSGGIEISTDKVFFHIIKVIELDHFVHLSKRKIYSLFICVPMQHLLDKNVNYMMEITFHTYIPRVDPGFSEGGFG